MFTGDRSGDWLFASLNRVGLATLPTSTSRDDGQELPSVRITAAVHCAPPDNKPTTAERHECASWLDRELTLITPDVRVMVALGGIAWVALAACLRRAKWSVPSGKFGHASTLNVTTPSGRPVTIVGCYHPSQQNTFTGRLTEPMLDAVFVAVRQAAGLG
jgi:uracil-DNA glycosylase family 4